MALRNYLTPLDTYLGILVVCIAVVAWAAGRETGQEERAMAPVATYPTTDTVAIPDPLLTWAYGSAAPTEIVVSKRAPDSLRLCAETPTGVKCVSVGQVRQQ